MPRLNYDIQPLKGNEICGAGAYNALLHFAAGFRSLSEFLTLNPDGRGSYTIDLDYAALVAALAQSDAAESLRHDFKCEIKGGGTPTLTVGAGRVFLPFNVVQVLGLTQALTNADNGKMVYVRMTSASSSTLVLDSPVTHTLQTGGGDWRVTLPVALLTLTDGVWGIHYLHIGAFILTHTPYFWLDGYVKGNAQILGHKAGENGVQWADVDASTSSSSGSSSGSGSSGSTSGSSSSGSGSSSGSSSSSSSGGTGDGFLDVTTNAQSPVGCEGAYYLASGDPHTTFAVWQRDSETKIHNLNGTWMLQFSDGFMANQYAIQTNSAEPTDATTWTNATALIYPASGTSATIRFTPV